MRDTEESLATATAIAAGFEPRRLRRTQHRRTIDYWGSIPTWAWYRAGRGCGRFDHFLRPSPHQVINLLPPGAYAESASSVANVLVHTSTNKVRCPVNVVRWVPDGRRLLTGSTSGEFTLWNGLTFNFETILQAHDSAVRAMEWSHAGTWLVSADQNGQVKYFQTNMNNVQAFQGHRDAVRGLSFAPDDQHFVTASDDSTLRIWNFDEATEESTLKGHGWEVKCVDWHPTQALLVSGSKDNLVKFWDPRSGTELGTFHGHKNTIQACRWHADGNLVATASRDQSIKLYDIRAMSELCTLKGHAKEVCSIEWHPVHHDLLVSGGSEGAMLYWSLRSTTPDAPICTMDDAHESNVWSLQWHPFGHLLASGSNDHTSRFWSRARPGEHVEEDRAVDGADDRWSSTQDWDDEVIPGLARRADVDLAPKGAQRPPAEGMQVDEAIPGLGGRGLAMPDGGGAASGNRTHPGAFLPAVSPFDGEGWEEELDTTYMGAFGSEPYRDDCPRETLEHRPATVPMGATKPATDADQAIAAARSSLARRHRALALIARLAPWIRVALVVLPLLLVVVLPIPREPFSRKVYVDENALQPGQTLLQWNLTNVAYADKVSAALDRVARADDDGQRIAYVRAELASFGLDTYTQAYAFHVRERGGGTRVVRGTNVYARSQTPRTDGREAMLLAASWRSRWKQPHAPGGGLPYTPPDGSGRAVNNRGVASVLALAQHLSSIPYWSKDIVFVISDGYLDGMQAWTTRYFGSAQRDLVAEEVRIGGAQIWNALALDYPADSFSSLSLLHEGRDGRLPNLDTMNSVTHIVQRLGFGTQLGLHGVTYDEAQRSIPDLETLVAWGVPRALCESAEHHVLGRDGIREYATGVRALLAQWRLLLAGHPSGVHGVLVPFHVDAVTLFAEPASGPNGFFEIGKVAEATMRSFSNLLERMHHSQFFYLLVSPYRFVPIGVYLFIPLLLSAALTLRGLALWNALGRRRDAERAALLRSVLGTRRAHDVLGDIPLAITAFREFAAVAHSAAGGDEACADFFACARPAWPALAAVGAAMAGGLLCLATVARAPLQCAAHGLLRCDTFVGVSVAAALIPVLLAALCVCVFGRAHAVALGECLHVFALLHAGMVASVLSTLNVAQATTMAALVGATLYAVPGGVATGKMTQRASRYTSFVQALGLVVVMPTTLVATVAAAAHLAVVMHAPGEDMLARLGAAVRDTVDGAIWDWHILHTGALTFLFLGYLPVLLEGATSCLLCGIRERGGMEAAEATEGSARGGGGACAGKERVGADK
ncbi:pre-mRNA cleavage and polyadenylation factor (CPF) complex subunit [Malassezia sp. CBS 17886]|nr:pre-mRNA cleavage and polyadenylation factor (CPF) complex subunit [Malassezia sp. CBS 17886]